MAAINFSYGTNTFDNSPVQLTVDDFGAFVDEILKDPASQKGATYICAGLDAGVHYQEPEKYQGISHWRLKNYGQKRRFLAFDFDGFETPEVFERLRDFLLRWNCLIYTTASYTPDKPRARAILELNREVTPDEGVRLGEAVQRCIEGAIGIDLITFDASVYRATQPIYTPLTSSVTYRHQADVLCVDEILRMYPPSSLLKTQQFSQTSDPFFSAGFELPVNAISEGGRNDIVLRYVGHLRKKGLNEAEIQTLALAVNQKLCSPPLDEAEVVNVCERYRHQSVAHIFATGEDAPVGGVCESNGRPSISDQPPSARNYIFAGQVTAGTLSVLGGQGGVSKTMLMMQTCVAAAVGSSLGNLSVSHGSSLLFLGEDDTAERDRRFGAICKRANADKATVEKLVKCYGAAGLDIRLTQKVDANAHETRLGEEVIRIAKAHQQATGVPLNMIVFDHARLVLGGDPNNAEDVTQLTRVLTNIARSTGAAVFLLAHSPKSVIAKAGSEINAADIAGSSAFVDNARAAFMMWTMREDEAKAHHVPLSERTDYVRLENVKANYARTGGGYWFKRAFMPGWDVAVLEQTYLHSKSVFEAKGVSALRDRILAEVRKKPGGVTERKLRDMAGKDGPLKASDQKVRVEVGTMLDDGLLERRAPSPDERKQHRLGGAVREVLVPLS